MVAKGTLTRMAFRSPASLAVPFGLALLALAGCPTRSPPPPASADAGSEPSEAPAVILLIGDGTGKGQLESASYYQSGTPDGLFVFTLPHQGELVTGSLSGITDSAASGTAMAAGVPTFNGRVGLDRDGVEVQNLIELAHERGWAAGVVTTSSLTHATPATFSAHVSSRYDSLLIADQQALETRAEVMLAGGAAYYLPEGPGSSRDDDGLLIPLEQSGYQIATTAAELAAASPARGTRLIGLFANYHLDYELDRDESSTQPALADMARAALAFLERDPDGFFLVIEGALIDQASHANNLERAIGETLAFDATVRAVADWAAGRDNVTILVTADHETGGLEIVEPGAAGEYPGVTWRRGGHTSDRVRVFGSGPSTGWIDGEVRDHRWIHAVARAVIEGEAVVRPERVAVPNGDLRELRHTPAVQTEASGFGVGFNQLDALHIDADPHGLALGVAGLFERGENAVVLLIDADFGAGSGVARFADALTDHTGTADSILSALAIDGSGIDGFGADLAVVIYGGDDPNIHGTSDTSGLRGLHPPFGFSDNLSWFPVPVIFAEAVRPSGEGLEARPAEGVETLVPWSRLYPDLTNAVPANATIAVAAVLVNSDGGYTSNQALPPFSPGTENPGRVEVALPGAVVFQIDSNGDWIADGDAAPHVVTQ